MTLKFRRPFSQFSTRRRTGSGVDFDSVPLHPDCGPEGGEVVGVVEVSASFAARLSFHLESAVELDHDIETIVSPEGMVTVRGVPMPSVILVIRCPGILTINKRESVSRVINISFSSRPLIVYASKVWV